MDKELASFRLNINQLASISGLHRQTVASRLKGVETAPGSNQKLKLYTIPAILAELMKSVVTVALADMTPTDRRAWFQSENERLKFEKEEKELIPASEVAREFSSMAKAVVQVLETLPDILERDCALPPAAVSRVQAIIDDIREQMANRVFEVDTPEEEEELPEEE